MFKESEIHDALEIQSKAYKLLQWVSEKIRKWEFDFEQIHQWTEDPSLARAWLRRQFVTIPPDCRPEKLDGPEFEKFANYFASYLLASFDVQLNKVPETKDGMWSWEIGLDKAGDFHLKTRKISVGDRNLAESLKRQYLQQLALDNSLKISETQLDEILADGKFSRAAAICTYLVETVRRCEGLPSGPEALVLWRQFAWNPAGAPIKGFRLQAEDVLSAEAVLLDILKQRTIVD